MVIESKLIVDDRELNNISNELFESSDLKKKYFDQAQEKTGVVSDLVRILNSFVAEYDAIVKTFLNVVNNLNSTYNHDSKIYDDKRREAQVKLNTDAMAVRSKAKDQVANEIQKMRDNIETVISADLPDGALDDIELIKTIAGHMTDDEAKIYLKKYKGCYLVSKILINSLADGQAERIGAKFVTTDEISEYIAYVENVSIDFIRKYNGRLTYGVATLLRGGKIEELNDAFESFISMYE